MIWTRIPLTDVCRPKQWPTLAKKNLSPAGFPVYGANGKIGFTDKFTHEKPTILIGCRGSCGTIHLTEPKSYANGNAMALDDFDTARLLLPWTIYYFGHRGFADAITGSSQPQITQQGLSRIQIPAPPLSEQERLVKLLDEADALRKLRIQADRRTADLIPALFQEMFGDPMAGASRWPLVPFESVTNRVTYGFTSPMKHLTSGLPIITAKNVLDGWIDFGNVHFADQAEFDALTAKSKPVRGDILVTKDGTIGRCAVVEVDFPFCINQSVALVQPNAKKVIAVYLTAYLLYPSVADKLQNMGKGQALKHLQITELAKLSISLPPVDLQRRFENAVTEIRDVEAVQAASRRRLDDLFQSMLHRAFSGEL